MDASDEPEWVLRVRGAVMHGLENLTHETLLADLQRLLGQRDYLLHWADDWRKYYLAKLDREVYSKASDGSDVMPDGDPSDYCTPIPCVNCGKVTFLDEGGGTYHVNQSSECRHPARPSQWA